MLRIFIFLASKMVNVSETTAVIDIDYAEFDAIYVPPDYTGPIVAIPTDEIYFCQGGE
jgi:hypothetical protein